MAKLNAVFGVDLFLTDTRVRTCINADCRFHTTNEFTYATESGDSKEKNGCTLKRIEIGGDGKCDKFESIEA